MEKKYIIILSVVAALWIGFMGFRHLKQKDEAAAHLNKEYRRIADAAQKSPRAGLSQMGKALQKYYSRNNRYPDKLIELYPDYIPNKFLIDEIDWFFESSENDFFLSKTSTVNNKKYVASIDKSMRPQIETESGVMLAKGRRRQQPKQPKVVDEFEEIEVPLTEEDFLAAPISPEFVPRQARRAIATPSDKGQERIVAVEDIPQEKGPASVVGKKYLVWRDKSGNLGFGNITYPESDKKTIYVTGKWLTLKKLPNQSNDSEQAELAIKEGKKTVDIVALGQISRYLAWKDKNGNLGFGNVNYPQTVKQTIYDRKQGWVELEQKMPPKLEPVAAIGNQQPLKKQPDDVVMSQISRYLAWRDKNGTLGFGNVNYPNAGGHTIYSKNEGWVELKSQKPAGNRSTAFETQEKNKDASAAGQGFLTWKNKDGSLGFGNVKYPEKNLSDVYIEGSWQPLNK